MDADRGNVNGSTEDSLLPDPCVFCKRNDLDSEEVGATLRKEGITVHEYCLYFSSGLAQRASVQEGVMGFVPEDIRGEVKRSQRLRCGKCQRSGAHIGCSVRSCPRQGHYPCLLSHGFLFQHFKNFKTFCPIHLPTQDHFDPDPLIFPPSCCICLAMIARVPSPSELYCPSCKTFFHKGCIQKQARTAGWYFFRCPTCNNSREFLPEMLRLGVEVPKRDAQWELDGHFSNEYVVEKHCQAEHCLCPRGRDYSTSLGRFCMRKCHTCGQYLGHVRCTRGVSGICGDCSPATPTTSCHPTPAPVPLAPRLCANTAGRPVSLEIREAGQERSVVPMKKLRLSLTRVRFETHRYVKATSLVRVPSTTRGEETVQDEAGLARGSFPVGRVDHSLEEPNKLAVSFPLSSVTEGCLRCSPQLTSKTSRTVGAHSQAITHSLDQPSKLCIGTPPLSSVTEGCLQCSPQLTSGTVGAAHSRTNTPPGSTEDLLRCSPQLASKMTPEMVRAHSNTLLGSVVPEDRLRCSPRLASKMTPEMVGAHSRANTPLGFVVTEDHLRYSPRLASEMTPETVRAYSQANTDCTPHRRVDWASQIRAKRRKV